MPLTRPIEVCPATNVRKKFYHHKILANFHIESSPLPPMVIGGGAETMYNQIIFIFSKEWHGTILSVHLTKFCKSEKWKKLIEVLLMKIISTFPKVYIIFQNNWSVYCIHILWICRQLKHHQLRIRSEIFISLEIILNAFNVWQYHFRLKYLFSILCHFPLFQFASSLNLLCC